MQALIDCKRTKNEIVGGTVVEDMSVKTSNCLISGTGGSLDARWDTELPANLSKTGEDKTWSSGFLSVTAVLEV